jgi:hypothetical protein
MPVLLRIEQALSTCGAHIHELRSQAGQIDTATLVRNSEIESYLVNYLLGAIYSEFEQYVRQSVYQRCSSHSDAGLSSFARAAVDRTVRKIKISDLGGHLASFDKVCKELFSQAVNDPSRSQEKAAYDSIIMNRHDFSHATGSPMTFEDLEQAYRMSLFILEEFERALGLA